MIVGSVHSTIYVDLLYNLKKTGYAGWLSMDQYPYREDATDAIAESIHWVRAFEQIVEENMAEIDALVRRNDAVATSRFMRKVLFGK
jgi:xylose isomerase